MLAVLSAQQRLSGPYRTSARNIAKTMFAKRGARALDATASTLDDYAAHLHVKAWVAQAKFRDKGIADANQEAKWVHAALWNEGRTTYRRRAGAAQAFLRAQVNFDEMPSSDASPEEILERKQQWESLQAGLDPREADLLSRLIDHNCNLSAVLRSYGSPVGYKAFARIVQNVIERASDFAQRDEDSGKTSGVEALYSSEESDMADLPQCFGLAWEPFGGSVCEGCGEKHNCLDALAKSAYQKALTHLKAQGKEPSIQNLSAELEINEEATRAVVQYASRLPIIGEAPAQPVRTPVPAQEPTPEEKTGELMQAAADAGAVPQETVDAAKEALASGFAQPSPSPSEQNLEKSQESAVPESEPPQTQEIPVAQESGAAVAKTAEAEQPQEKGGEVVQLPTKTKAKSKPVKRATKAKAQKKAVPVVPKKASAAVSAAALAKTKKAKPKSAKPAKGRGATPAKKPAKKRSIVTVTERVWGKHTAQARWEREREKNPLVAALTPGVKLRREYKGELKEVKVQNGYYTFAGQQFPTLQAATTAATGAKEYPKQEVGGKRQKGTRLMGNWSAAKFWKLKEVAAHKSK